MIQKSQVNDKEAEIERLNLQILELSNKITNEPEKNMIENLLQNAEGTFLKINVKEITLNQEFETLMYTVQAENYDEKQVKNAFISSAEVNNNGNNTFIFPQALKTKNQYVKSFNQLNQSYDMLCKSIKA